MLLNLSSGFHHDVAYDPSSNRYLVAYEVPYSQTEAVVEGTLVDADSLQVLSYLSLSPLLFNEARHPAVAGHRSEGDFLVAWQQRYTPVASDWDIHAVQVDPLTGAKSKENKLASGPGDQRSPRLSGNSGTSNTSLLVFEDEGSGWYASRVNYASTGPWIDSWIDLHTPASAKNVAVTRSAGPGGRHLVAWESTQQVLFFPPEQRIGAVVLSDEGVLLHEAPFIGPAVLNGQERRPSVTGNGTDFVIVYLRDEPLDATPWASEVRGHRLRWDGAQLVPELFDELIFQSSGEDLTEATCSLVGEQVLFLWKWASGLSRAAAADRETFVVCEELGGEFDGPLSFQQDFLVVAEGSTGDVLSRDALVSWNSSSTTVVSPILTYQNLSLIHI